MIEVWADLKHVPFGVNVERIEVTTRPLNRKVMQTPVGSHVTKWALPSPRTKHYYVRADVLKSQRERAR